MINDLNPIRTTVTVSGKKCLFISLKLKQEYNKHHELDLVINHKDITPSCLNCPEETFSLVGEEVVVSMEHERNGPENTFRGIITQAGIDGQEIGDHRIVINAKGYTVLMDGKKTMDSYTDKNLFDIIKQATSNSIHNAQLLINPGHNTTIDYICQYNESDFEFMNRLSYLYGESFWYTGSEIRFGQDVFLDKKPYELTYGRNLCRFNYSARIVPARFRNCLNFSLIRYWQSVD